SSGIGRRIAEVLAEQGFYVYAGARKPEDIESLSKLPYVSGIRLDVTRQGEIDAAVRKIRASGRGLYGLVNNAGVFLYDPLIETEERDLQFIFDVNVFGPYRVTKAFAPLIIESKGRITTTGSIASTRAGRLFGPYSMSKAAVVSFTEALASEMSKFDVSVSVVQPGNFRSDIMRNMALRESGRRHASPPSLWQQEIKRFSRFTQPDRSHHADPRPVAETVADFMTTTEPKLRYMVTPNQQEANMTIRSALKRSAELNSQQTFEMSRDELVAVLDAILVEQGLK
ncbi:MAG: SDR family NAD(P)-dependent oxidoreductase, partial [Pseudomonadota bacterium]